jgi:lia operon protein LiaG
MPVDISYKSEWRGIHMRERGKNILPMIGFILIVAVIFGGFAMANTFNGNSDVKTIEKNNKDRGLLKKNLFGNYDIDETSEISTKGTDRITINAVSSEINIQTHDSEKVEAHFYGDVSTLDPDARPFLEATKKGDTIAVAIKYPKTMSSFTSERTCLDVKIPKRWAEDLEVTSVSGKISAPELTGKDIRINSTSGSIQIDNITGKNIRLVTTSGDFKLGELIARDTFKQSTISGTSSINKVEAEDIKLEVTSGSTSIQNAICEKVTSSSISGSVEINLKDGSAEMASSSGNIQVRFEEGFNDFSAKSISGSVNLDIPEYSEFELEVKTISGDVKCGDFDMRVISTKKNNLKAITGDGDSKIDIQTSSGNVRIQKN